MFGESGERGEYMDGYSEQAMLERCEQDYKWAKRFSRESFLSERAKMVSHARARRLPRLTVCGAPLFSQMSHLYANEQLWTHVCMVGFAEHYVLTNGTEEDIAKPFDTFQLQKRSRPPEAPIFGGVVLQGWQDDAGGVAVEHKVGAFKEAGVDYIRLECNLGSVDEIGEPSRLADDPRFRRLAEVAMICQKQEIVPLILLQLPWREKGDHVSSEYFKHAVESFAKALKSLKVELRGLLFETRPPMALSAQEEKGLSGTARESLGLEIGRQMFEIIDQAFDGDAIAGFCVAGGSTKGDLPLAMEDDTQNAVRQGMRQRARRRWGYEACFWEMGAKLMLQPKVGRLWGQSQAGRDAARELFRVNAEDMAEEIMTPL